MCDQMYELTNLKLEKEYKITEPKLSIAHRAIIQSQIFTKRAAENETKKKFLSQIVTKCVTEKK